MHFPCSKCYSFYSSWSYMTKSNLFIIHCTITISRKCLWYFSDEDCKETSCVCIWHTHFWNVMTFIFQQIKDNITEATLNPWSLAAVYIKNPNLVITEPADGLAPNGARLSAGTMLTTYRNTLQWHHHGCDGVSNHQPHECLLNCLLGRKSKKTSKLRATGLCAGN